MIRALILAVALAGCAPTADLASTLKPRATLLADQVVLNIRVDFRNDPRIADIIAGETARLLGPEFDIPTMTGLELILNMTGRLSHGLDAEQPTLVMDWDVRDQGGTSIALYRVAIRSSRTLLGGISERDAQGIAFYTAEALTQQDGIRQIVLARRAAQGS